MCDEKVSGAGPEKLSMNLREHFNIVHEMKVIDEVSRFNSEPSGGRTPDSMKVIDEVARFNKEPSGGRTPDSMKVIDEVARFDKEPSGGGSSESMNVIQVVTRFQKEPVSGKSIASESCKGPTDGKVKVNCPICGCPMYGQDDNNLSGVLRGHMTTDHHL